MKKLLLLLVAMNAIPVLFAEGKLIKQVNFEKTAGLYKWPESVTIELDAEDPKQGKSSIVFTPDNSYVAYFYQKMAPDREYSISFWYKLAKIPIKRCGVLLNFTKKAGKAGDAGAKLISMSEFAEADGKWHQYSAKFTAPPETESCQVQLTFYRTDAIVNIDDLRLNDESITSEKSTEKSEPPASVKVSSGKLIKQLKFEDIKGLYKWPTSVNIELEKNDDKNVKPSIVFSPDNNYAVYFYHRLTPEVEYTAEFDWKADLTPIPRCGFSLYFTSKGGKRGDLGEKMVPLSSFGEANGEWKHSSFKFVVPPQTDICQFMLAFYRTNATVNIADLKIYEEGKVPTESSNKNQAQLQVREEPRKSSAGNDVQPPMPTPVINEQTSENIVTTMPPLNTKRPYLPRKQSGYAFSSNIENIAYVSAEIPSMIHFMPINESHKPELFIAVPKGIKILSAFRDIKLAEPTHYTINNQNFELYKTILGTKPAKYTFIWQAAEKIPAGTKLTGFYWGEWADGKQEPQLLNIQVVNIPQVKTFEQIPVWISMPNDFFVAWPDMKTLKSSGFNYIDMWTYLNASEYNWGIKLIEQTQAKTRPAEMGEIAWIREWWWHNGKAEDGKATLIDGKLSADMLCLSYRGKWYKALIEQGKALIDKQIYFHSTDPEMYSNGDKICFCEKCKQRFKDYLAQNNPGIAYIDPVIFEKNPDKHLELHAKWQEFKCYSYAAFFSEYRQAMEKYMAAKGIKQPFKWMIYSTYHRSYPGFYGATDYRKTHIYIKTLEDPEMLGKIFDFISPMAYMDVFANYEKYDMLLTWKDTIVLRRITRDKVVIAPLLCAGYPFVYAFDSDLNAEMLKYNMLEVIAGGGRGFGFWGECPFDAADMKSVAEVVGMLVPYEKLILSGTPGERIKALSQNAIVKRLESPEGSLVLVSEYSRRPLTVSISCPVDKICKVINLETNKTIGNISPENPTFSVDIKNERAVMLYVGR